MNRLGANQLKGKKIGSCCANPRINTGLRLYPRNLVPTRYYLPRDSEAFCRCFRPCPRVCLKQMKRCTCTTLNQNFHHAILLHRSGTPFIRCSQTCPFTTQLLMSLPGCCEASTRPHMHTRRSSRLRSSSIGPCGGSVVPEGGEGGAPQGG